MSWLKEVIGTEKAIIAMCHFAPLPGDPGFKSEQGMEYAVDRARKDLKALQNGGVDAVMFSNEFSLPYLTDVKIDDPIYQNTRRFVWSEDNPYFFRGKAGEGFG